jgi:SAM-dependent methyltransferase
MADFDRFARFYDLDYDVFQDDVPFYLGLAELTGGPVLELGCGTGRLLAPLARAGFEVTGVDASSGMLQVAGGKVAGLGKPAAQRITLVQADMRTVALPQQFRLAFIAFNSFLHLTNMQDQLRALRAWHQALVPGGLLAIDVDNPHPQPLAEIDGRLEVQNRWLDPATGATVLKQVTRTLDAGRQLQHVVFIYDEVFPSGEVKRTLAPFDARYLHRFEGELLLDKAGFALEQVYGSYDLDPYTGESDRMIFLARRL